MSDRRLTPEVIAGLRRDNEEAKSKGWRAEVGVDDLDLLLDAVDRERLASVLYRMNGHAWYGRDLGDWDDPDSRIGRNEYERVRWYGQADALLAVEPR